MISRIKGVVIEITSNALVVDIHGVGLSIFTPKLLQTQASLGEIVELFTHLIVREDSLTLYGFDNQEQRRFFELLITVDGIGPRTALAVVSEIQVSDAYRAILADNPSIFSNVSGIGKKTAQKIIFSLHEKVPKGNEQLNDHFNENADLVLLEALIKLGYNNNEARSAISSIPEDCPDNVEERLRQALRFFSE